MLTMQSHAGNAVGINHVFGQSVAAVGFAILGLVLEAVGKHGKNVDVLGLQAGNEVVNEGQVAAHPVGRDRTARPRKGRPGENRAAR